MNKGKFIKVKFCPACGKELSKTAAVSNEPWSDWCKDCEDCGLRIREEAVDGMSGASADIFIEEIPGSNNRIGLI